MHAKQAFLLRERAIFPGSGSSCALASCPRGEGFPDMSGPPYGSKTDAKQAEPGSDMVNSCVCISDPHFAESRAFSCKRLGEHVSPMQFPDKCAYTLDCLAVSSLGSDSLRR